jgi:hypothetical protein
MYIKSCGCGSAAAKHTQSANKGAWALRQQGVDYFHTAKHNNHRTIVKQY